MDNEGQIGTRTISANGQFANPVGQSSDHIPLEVMAFAIDLQ